MDLTSPKYFEANGVQPLEGKNGILKKIKNNPFEDTFSDPLCKLNLKETSEFVRSLPMANNGNDSRGLVEISAQQRKREGGLSLSSVTRRSFLETPSTPGRPIFSFSVGKSFPSKWDDAEKWLVSNGSSQVAKQTEEFAEKSRVVEEKVSKVISNFQESLCLDNHISARAFNGVPASADVLLKDKFTNEEEQIFPKFRCSEPTKEGFLFKNAIDKSHKNMSTEVIHGVQHRDMGTEMTPLGSSTTSRCHTPFKPASPARHNTPENRSGPLALAISGGAQNTIDIAKLQECHLAKLELGTQFDSVMSHWSSREEEEEDISKSLRHFEMSNECRRSVSENRTSAWEEEENTKFCHRYQREEAKIQAWVNLQSAKAEAQSRKLEVKIEKMRSNLEEKLMKRMAVVHRKAEVLRAAAQLQHSEQIQRAKEQAQTKMNRASSHLSQHSSCGCFPCTNSHYH